MISSMLTCTIFGDQIKFSWIESTKGELIVYLNYILSSSYSTSNGGLVDYMYLNYMM